MTMTTVNIWELYVYFHISLFSHFNGSPFLGDATGTRDLLFFFSPKGENSIQAKFNRLTDNLFLMICPMI